jgi:hypothetical protein
VQCGRAYRASGDDDGAAAGHGTDEFAGRVVFGEPKQASGVGQPGAGAQVLLYTIGGDAVVDHECAGEDAPGSVPEGAVGVVNQPLGTAEGSLERGAGVGGERATGGQDKG